METPPRCDWSGVSAAMQRKYVARFAASNATAQGWALLTNRLLRRYDGHLRVRVDHRRHVAAELDDVLGREVPRSGLATEEDRSGADLHMRRGITASRPHAAVKRESSSCRPMHFGLMGQ